MKSIIILSIFSIVFLTSCASTNSNLDELDRMELQDQMIQSGQTFQQKQLSGEICHNPSY